MSEQQEPQGPKVGEALRAALALEGMLVVEAVKRRAAAAGADLLRQLAARLEAKEKP